MERRAGIHLPVSSLPGPFGIGDFGPAAFRFLDDLVRAGQRSWQLLPLLIPDHTGSPFAPISAMAGNWLLVSPGRLVADGLLPRRSLAGLRLPESRVDYGKVNVMKRRAIGLSWLHFRERGTTEQRERFRDFVAAEAEWLEPYCLFMALKDRAGGASWTSWPSPLRDRDQAALTAWRNDHRDEVDYFAYGQWLFAAQWQTVKEYANERGIEIIGDLPHFVTRDSTDVWLHRDLFLLDGTLKPRLVAGAPPDEILATGQYWGNPLYDWQAMERQRFSWWLLRLRQSLMWYDRVRLDHFRGFAAVWGMPAGNHDAQTGSWLPVPGIALLSRLRASFPTETLVAEDLGVVTEDVVQLRNRFGIPGMRVLLFGLRSDDSPHRPDKVEARSVAYTGTHDLPTTRQWLAEASPEDRTRALALMNTDEAGFSWKLIAEGSRCRADTFIAPLQDVLDLGPEARMNQPGTTTNNWSWRMKAGEFGRRVQSRLHRLTEQGGRLG